MADCGAIVVVGRPIWTMETAVIVHANEKPIVFTVVSLISFAFFNFTAPLKTAIIFILSAILLDLVVVAFKFEKSYSMLSSLIGTWVAFGLLFLATHQIGSLVVNRKPHPPAI